MLMHARLAGISSSSRTPLRDHDMSTGSNKNHSNLLCLLRICLSATGAHAFIAPQEIPSILSLVYSNIPPVKKGTDSRVGFGYRLGEHADFQVLFELGPQTNTKAIGEPFSTAGGGDTSKRNVNQQDYKKQPDYKVVAMGLMT